MFFQDSKRPGELLGWRRTLTRQLAVLSLLRVTPGPTPGLRIGILRRWGGSPAILKGAQVRAFLALLHNPQSCLEAREALQYGCGLWVQAARLSVT